VEAYKKKMDEEEAHYETERGTEEGGAGVELWRGGASKGLPVNHRLPTGLFCSL